MKDVPVLEMVTLFFLDLIGFVVPGAALLLGTDMLFHWLPTRIHIMPPDEFGWFVLIIGGYVMGHAVNGLGTFIRRRLFAAENKKVWKGMGERESFQRVMEHYRLTVPTWSEDDKALAGKKKEMKARDKTNVRACESARNVAMTEICLRDKQTVYKFMFMSLLNQGAATVLSIFAIIALLRFEHLESTIPAVSVSFALVLLFGRQSCENYERSMTVPFEMVFPVIRKREIAAAKSTAASNDRVQMRAEDPPGSQTAPEPRSTAALEPTSEKRG